MKQSLSAQTKQPNVWPRLVAMVSPLTDQSVGYPTFSDGSLAARRHGSLGLRPQGAASLARAWPGSQNLSMKCILSYGLGGEAAGLASYSGGARVVCQFKEAMVWGVSRVLAVWIS